MNFFTGQFTVRPGNNNPPRRDAGGTDDTAGLREESGYRALAAKSDW
jgi:hypothetical protein